MNTLKDPLVTQLSSAPHPIIFLGRKHCRILSLCKFRDKEVHPKSHLLVITVENGPRLTHLLDLCKVVEYDTDVQIQEPKHAYQYEPQGVEETPRIRLRLGLLVLLSGCHGVHLISW